mmetsp:Transcript_60916/g.176189  ORF Transcript_60916/g.176189 Transcript_60916/m.176189 type:complete len:225 (-) Transcript_60916:1050-1724(-)
MSTSAAVNCLSSSPLSLQNFAKPLPSMSVWLPPLQKVWKMLLTRSATSSSCAACGSTRLLPPATGERKSAPDRDLLKDPGDLSKSATSCVRLLDTPKAGLAPMPSPESLQRRLLCGGLVWLPLTLGLACRSNSDLLLFTPFLPMFEKAHTEAIRAMVLCGAPTVYVAERPIPSDSPKSMSSSESCFCGEVLPALEAPLFSASSRSATDMWVFSSTLRRASSNCL